MNPQEKQTMEGSKEKANMLIAKFALSGDNPTQILSNKQAIECSIIAVNEILQNIDAAIFYHKESKALPINKQFWNEVKEHLTNLN